MTSFGSIDCPYYHLVPKGLDENLAYRRELVTIASESPETAAQIRTMCAEDMLFYVNAFGWTYDPRSSVKVAPFITYVEFQDEAMCRIVEGVEVGRDVAIAKSRDMGASWMGLTVFEWLWHFRPDMSFLLVSRNEDYVDKRGNPKSLFWKIDFLHQHQPKWLLPEGRWLGQKDPNRKLLHLKNADNGSVIDGESTTGDAGRGDRRSGMFIDEHAAFGLDEGYRVLRATRDTTNCRVFNSTPQGMNNGFADVVHKTAADQIRLHWSDHPEKKLGLYTTNPKNGKVELLDDFKGWVNVRKKGGKPKRVLYPDEYPFELDKQDPKVRSPWYDEQCARCVSPQEVAQELDIDFLGSDFPFFDPKFIQGLIKRYCRKPLLVGDLRYDRETLEPKRFTENPKGNIQLWITLDGQGRPAEDRRFVIGADISAGTGASNSVNSIADRDTGEKIGVFRTPNMRPHTFSGYTLALARFFSNAYLVPDASGPTGKVFITRVIANSYPNIYYRRNEKKVTKKISDEPGYYLNAVARESLLEEYRAALSDLRFINRSEAGMNECLQFIRTPTGIEHSASANSQDPSGARTAHGDEVVADALCCLGVYERQREMKAEEPALPTGSLAHRMAQSAADAEESDRELGDGW